MLKKLWKDESGAVVSIDLLIVCGAVFTGLGTAWATISTALVTKISALATAVGSIVISF